MSRKGRTAIPGGLEARHLVGGGRRAHVARQLARTIRVAAVGGALAVVAAGASLGAAARVAGERHTTPLHTPTGTGDRWYQAPVDQPVAADSAAAATPSPEPPTVAAHTVLPPAPVNPPDPTPPRATASPAQPPTPQLPALRSEGPPPPPAPGGAIDSLTSLDGTLDVHVGSYSDCNGTTPLRRDEAERDTCFVDREYFIGHNPGVFTPLMHMGPGSRLTWHDHAGTAHDYQVLSIRDLPASAGPPAPTTPSVVAQLQTCTTADGTVVRVLDAVPYPMPVDGGGARGSSSLAAAHPSPPPSPSGSPSPPAAPATQTTPSPGGGQIPLPPL